MNSEACAAATNLNPLAPYCYVSFFVWLVEKQYLESIGSEAAAEPAFSSEPG